MPVENMLEGPWSKIRVVGILPVLALAHRTERDQILERACDGTVFELAAAGDRSQTTRSCLDDCAANSLAEIAGRVREQPLCDRRQPCTDRAGGRARPARASGGNG